MNRLFLCLIILLLPLALLVQLYRTLPGHLQLPQGVREEMVFLDRHGLPIRSYAPGESYDWIRLTDVPSDQIELLLLAEDKNFYQHSGVDLKGLARSTWQNLRHFKILSGASTIDQQVYRLAHQEPRSWYGKLRTILGAYKLNKRYTKDQLLQFYVNHLPYARRVVGLKRAAQVLFGKELALLSLSEKAALAVLPRAPGLLQSSRAAGLLDLKKNALLARYPQLIQNEEQLALEKKIKVSFLRDYSGWENYHFIARLMENQSLNRYIHSGQIETTLDLYLQREVSAILKSQIKHLEAFQVSHGAVIVLDNKHGDVLSYVGSHDLASPTSGLVDALQVPRQPGSALKPLTYALALQKGKTLADPLPDIPSYYKTGLGQFLPRNYDQSFSGPRLMREALANSLNLPAVALAEELGVENLHRFYRALGLSLPKDASYYGVGLTLGNVEITPLELAQVYSGFARETSRVEARFFLQAPVTSTDVPLKKETSFLISDVLSDHLARREEFGERNPFDLPFTFAVKTGTSTDFRDNWAVGYNSLYTIVVWVGNMNQKGMKKVSGITGAGPVLAAVARTLMKDRFLPSEVPQHVTRKDVCALSGKLPTVHCQHHKREWFVQGSAPQEQCDFHRALLVQGCYEEGDQKSLNLAVFPEMYQAFVQERPQWSLQGQIGAICPRSEAFVDERTLLAGKHIHIQRPLPESVYAIDPHLPLKLQKLKIQLNQIQGIKQVHWKIGESLLEGSSTLDWPMQRGEHSISAEVELLDGTKQETPKLKVTVL